MRWGSLECESVEVALELRLGVEMMVLLGVPESLSSLYFLMGSFFSKRGFEGSHDGWRRVEPEKQMGGQNQKGIVDEKMETLYGVFDQRSEI